MLLNISPEVQEADCWGVKERIVKFLKSDESAIYIQRAYFRWKGLKAKEERNQKWLEWVDQGGDLTKMPPLPIIYQPRVGCGVRWGGCELNWKPDPFDRRHAYVCEPCATSKHQDLAMAPMPETLGRCRYTPYLGMFWMNMVSCFICHERCRRQIHQR